MRLIYVSVKQNIFIEGLDTIPLNRSDLPVVPDLPSYDEERGTRLRTMLRIAWRSMRPAPARGLSCGIAVRR